MPQIEVILQMRSIHKILNSCEDCQQKIFKTNIEEGRFESYLSEKETLNVMVIVVGNEIGEQSSHPRLGCLWFTSS